MPLLLRSSFTFLLPSTHNGRPIYLNIEVKHEWLPYGQAVIDALVTQIERFPHLNLSERMVVASQ